MCSYAGVLLCLCDRIIAGLQRCAFTSKHACVYVDVRSPEITMPVQTHRVCVFPAFIALGIPDRFPHKHTTSINIVAFCLK